MGLCLLPTYLLRKAPVKYEPLTRKMYDLLSNHYPHIRQMEDHIIQQEVSIHTMKCKTRLCGSTQDGKSIIGS